MSSDAFNSCQPVDLVQRDFSRERGARGAKNDFGFTGEGGNRREIGQKWPKDVVQNAGFPGHFAVERL